MCEGDFDVFALEMHDGIQSVSGHRVVEQVFESVAAQYPSAVIHYGESRVQVGVVTEHRLYDVVVEGVVLEEFGVWLEVDVCSVLVVGLFCHVTLQLSALKNRSSYLSISI